MLVHGCTTVVSIVFVLASATAALINGNIMHYSICPQLPCPNHNSFNPPSRWECRSQQKRKNRWRKCRHHRAVSVDRQHATAGETSLRRRHHHTVAHPDGGPLHRSHRADDAYCAGWHQDRQPWRTNRPGDAAASACRLQSHQHVQRFVRHLVGHRIGYTSGWRGGGGAGRPSVGAECRRLCLGGRMGSRTRRCHEEFRHVASGGGADCQPIGMSKLVPNDVDWRRNGVCWLFAWRQRCVPERFGRTAHERWSAGGHCVVWYGMRPTEAAGRVHSRGVLSGLDRQKRLIGRKLLFTITAMINKWTKTWSKLEKYNPKQCLAAVNT